MWGPGGGGTPGGGSGAIAAGDETAVLTDTLDEEVLEALGDLDAGADSASTMLGPLWRRGAAVTAGDVEVAGGEIKSCLGAAVGSTTTFEPIFCVAK
jgi:hypothetical protein